MNNNSLNGHGKFKGGYWFPRYYTQGTGQNKLNGKLRKYIKLWPDGTKITDILYLTDYEIDAEYKKRLDILLQKPYGHKALEAYRSASNGDSVPDYKYNELVRPIIDAGEKAIETANQKKVQKQVASKNNQIRQERQQRVIQVNRNTKIKTYAIAGTATLSVIVLGYFIMRKQM